MSTCWESLCTVARGFSAHWYYLCTVAREVSARWPSLECKKIYKNDADMHNWNIKGSYGIILVPLATIFPTSTLPVHRFYWGEAMKYSLMLQYFCARGFSVRWESKCMRARRVSARWESKCMYARRVSAHWDNWNQCTFVYQQKIMHINTTSTSTWSHVQSYLSEFDIWKCYIVENSSID